MTKLLLFSVLLAVSTVTVLGEDDTKNQAGSQSNVQNATICTNQNLIINCKENNSSAALDVIAIKKQYFATKPKTDSCSSACCSVNETTDCVYSNQDHLPDVISACSGNSYCATQVRPSYNKFVCPKSSLYSAFSKLGFVEYECINIYKLTDICHDGIVKRDKMLYINSNTFHKNTDHVNTTCSCVITTQCQNSIQINAVDVRLARNHTDSTCFEELRISDKNKIKSITCNNVGLNTFRPVFTSGSNAVHIDLTTTTQHTGKVWLQVQGVQKDSDINVKCGSTVILPTDEDHLCEDDKISTPSTDISTPEHITSTSATVTSDSSTFKPASSTVTPGSSTVTPGIPTVTPDSSTVTPNNPTVTPDSSPVTPGSSTVTPESSTLMSGSSDNDKLTGLSGGVIGGVTTAVVIILLILIIILVLVFRSRKHQEREADVNYLYATQAPLEDDDHSYQSLGGATLSDQATGVSNPVYDDSTEKCEKPPLDHTYDNHHFDPESVYDNAVNEYNLPENKSRPP